MSLSPAGRSPLFPKPRAHRLVRQDRKRVRNALIAAVRQSVLRRDAGRCRACQCLLEGFSVRRGEMHEIVSRARFAGQRKPITDLFNTRNCLMLCRGCHVQVTDHVIEVVPEDDTLGADGSVEFRTL